MGVGKPMTPQTGWVLLTLSGVVAMLHFAQDVLVPVALAVLLAFLLTPLVNRAERRGANRALAVALTTLLAFTVIGALSYTVAHQFLGLVQDLPSYRENLLAKVKSVPGPAGGGLERSIETVQDLSEELRKAAPAPRDEPNVARVRIVEPPPNVAQVVSSLFGPLVKPASTAAIVIVFVIFMLLQREDLRDRLVRLLGAGAMHTTVMALDDAAERVSRYLLMQTLINTIQGALVAAGLALIGVPDALLWGALTIVLRFIPYLGPVLAAAGPIALATAVFSGWTEPLLVVGLIVALELISNNVLEPRLYGASVGVSSFALIVAAVFWTWLWGTAGLFLATPLTVCLVVMGKYIPQLEFLGVMLGDQPVLEPRERFYQRLLANDPEEAQDLVDESLQEQSLLEVCDRIVLPALRFVEQDHDRGAIDDTRRTDIVEQIGEFTDEWAMERSAERAGAPQMSVLCLPAADLADEVAARLLALVLPPSGMAAHALASARLKNEMIERVARDRPAAVCISAVPPAAVVHARYLCKKLRARFADLPIVVGLWDAKGDLQKATERLTAAGADKVVTSAGDAVVELSRLLEPLRQGVRAPSAAAPIAAR